MATSFPAKGSLLSSVRRSEGGDEPDGQNNDKTVLPKPEWTYTRSDNLLRREAADASMFVPDEAHHDSRRTRN